MAEQVFDQRGAPMGLTYERSPRLSRSKRMHATAVWLVPLGATVVEVALPGADVVVLDKRTVSMVPAGQRYALRSRTAVVELCTLHFHPELWTLTATEYAGKIDRTRLARIFEQQVSWPRTNWINELCHRYVFERVVCSRHGSGAARFCEIELTKELYYFARERERRQSRPHLLEGASELTTRAVGVLEAHLFERFDNAMLAKRVGSSPSTLLRAFQRDLGMPPSSYARTRRLDEAMLLLKSGRYPVTDVAGMVGYQTVAAFSHAFHRRFGQTPSTVKPRDPNR